jgi:dolichol-phosphate mannosyltransferase
MKIAITMPAFNEERICEFISDIDSALNFDELYFVVVNDNSTTPMVKQLKTLGRQSGINIEILTNLENLGHGPSTIKGLRESLTYDPDLIIAVDGDGQFLTDDIKKCLNAIFSTDIDVIEGCRVNRSDPLFRKVSTKSARMLVRSVCGVAPKDANTPLRMYKPQVLTFIINSIDANLMTPNLYVSAFSRLRSLNILEIDVTSTDRRGDSKSGTTWKQKINWLPSKRFLKFCLKAAFQWFAIVRPSLKKFTPI